MKLLLTFILFCVPLSMNANPLEEKGTGDCFWVYDYVTRVPNFPKENINFLCYPDLLQNPPAFKDVIKTLAKRYKDQNITMIAGLEARGFVFGVALAYEMDLPFVMVRKKGKLPRKTRCVKYGLEYGVDEFEIEEESIVASDNVLIVDDLLATGGTASAAIHLIEELGAKVHEVAIIFEMDNLQGRTKVPSQVFSLLKVDE